MPQTSAGHVVAAWFGPNPSSRRGSRNSCPRHHILRACVARFPFRGVGGTSPHSTRSSNRRISHPSSSTAEPPNALRGASPWLLKFCTQPSRTDMPDHPWQLVPAARHPPPKSLIVGLRFRICCGKRRWGLPTSGDWSTRTRQRPSWASPPGFTSVPVEAARKLVKLNDAAR